MKAKVKATGEIVDVYREIPSTWRVNEIGGDYYEAEELEFIKKQSATIEGWVARDEDGRLFFHSVGYLKRNDGVWIECYGGIDEEISLSTTTFPDLKWEDEPRKVKLTIEEI